MFTPIQIILPRAASALGVRREVEAALVCEKYRKLAPTFVHKDALEHTRPKSYKGRTLIIGVENPAWAGQVISRKAELIKEINASLGKRCIENLKTQVMEDVSPPSF